MGIVKEFLAGLPTGIVYAGSIFLILAIILITSFSNETSIFYRMASKFIGHEPEAGDGAFQFPLGWLIMLFTSIVLGSIVAYLLTKTR